MDEKKKLRRLMKARLKQVDEKTYQNWSNKIAQYLLHTEQWKKAHTIGVTISMEREVNTYSIIEHGWEQNKQMVVPKSKPKDREMVFYTLETFEQLHTGFAGIREPIEHETKPVDADDIDLLIVPGLIFDHRGYRIGFGGGFYDRFLANYNGETVSLAFDIQRVQELPIGQYDLPVQVVITNKGIWNSDD